MIREQVGQCDPSLCFLFFDSIRLLPDKVVGQVLSSFGPSCTVVGGGSVPPSGVQDVTLVSFGGEVIDNGIVLLAMVGDLKCAAAAYSSWQPIGTPGQVTQVEGNLIRQINGRPAVEFYTKQHGVTAESYLGVPLGLVDSQGDVAVRAPFLEKDGDGALRLATQVQEGQDLRVCYATHEDILKGVSKAGDRAQKALGDGGDPSMVFFSSCVVRKLFLSLDVETEIEQLANQFGHSVPIIGFYAYGEVGGSGTAGHERFHNQAIVAWVVQ